MVSFRPLITPLFVPANRPERFRKAAESGADAIIVDLEDAVPTAEKHRAREALADGLLDNLPVPVYLRVNGRATSWHAFDLGLAATLPIAGIMLPKAEGVGDLRLVAQRLGAALPIIALVETAVGMAELHKIVGAPNLSQIAFGSVDFALDIGSAHERDSLAFARGQIVLHSRVHRLAAPLDGVTVATSDTSLLASDCAHAAALGFGGKLAIHPAQIATISRAFRPSPQEVEWARRILAAEQASGGAAIQLDGMMIDAPVWERARQILTKAG